MWNNLFRFLYRNNHCYIPPGAVVHGGLDATGPLIIAGTVYGDVHAGASLHLGSSGVIFGNIHARTIVVHGKIQGDVTVLLKGIIKNNAVVTGSLNASPLVIEQNAVVEARLNHSQEQKEAVPSSWI